MYKSKNLWILLGVGAAAYYYFWMMKKKKAAASTTPAVKNFTGDHGILAKQNFTGTMGY